MKKIFFLITLFISNLIFANDEILKRRIETMIMPDFRYWKMQNEEKEKAFTTMNEEVKQVISSHNYGGVILFAQNVEATEQTYNLTKDLQEASNTPLFIAIDQEGGIVARLNSGTRFPGNMAIGATNNEKYAYEVGRTIGSELKALGINVNFAPSLDVNNNPKNPVIGLRSFSSNPKIVAKLGNAMIKGYKSEGIIATAKHFPGHGDTDTDTHASLAVVNKDYNELSKMEFYPFKQAINNNIEMIMTAHVQLPKIDNSTIISKKDGKEVVIPATISKKILTDTLRNKLGFKGVIVTDALGMGAISDNLTTYDTLKSAINAGADILLMPIELHSLENVKALDEVVDKLVLAVKNGEIPESRINESFTRIMNLKLDSGILKKANKSTLEDALKTVGSKEHKDLERKISFDSITVLKYKKLENPKNLEILVTDESQKTVSAFAIERLFNENKVERFNYSIDIYGENTTKEQIQQFLQGKDTVIVYGAMNAESALKNDSYRTKIPNMVAEFNNIQKIYVSINKPYDATYHLNYDKVLISYGYIGLDPTEKNPLDKSFGPNIPAALEVILLNKNRKLNLPVDLPKIENESLTNKVLYKVQN